METDVCRRFNPLMLNPFKLPNLLHTNNNYVVLLFMEPLLSLQAGNSLHTHFMYTPTSHSACFCEENVDSEVTALRYD